MTFGAAAAADGACVTVATGLPDCTPTLACKMRGGASEPVAWARPTGARVGRADTSCVSDAMRTVEAAVAVEVVSLCAKTSPKAASPRIINAATIMTTKRM